MKKIMVHEIKKIAIVSRHPATISWLKSKFPTATLFNGNVTAEDLKPYAKVIGNLPMGIACFFAGDFQAVEFEKFPPRGVDLTPEQLEEYGIRLVSYSVFVGEKPQISLQLQVGADLGIY